MHPRRRSRLKKEVIMNRKSMSLARVFFVLPLCLLCLISAARADIGPKPEVTITVVNAPEGELSLGYVDSGSGRLHADWLG